MGLGIGKIFTPRSVVRHKEEPMIMARLVVTLVGKVKKEARPVRLPNTEKANMAGA